MQIIISHGIVLLAAFAVRYNGLYYPIISIIAILFSKLSKPQKRIGIGFLTTTLAIFIINTGKEYKHLTGKFQFSAFGGWQLAANSLYGYAHSNITDTSKVPYKYRELHKIVNAHMLSLQKIPDFLRPDHNVDIYYLWDFRSPLRIYLENNSDSSIPYFNRWAALAPLYADYGGYLIKTNAYSYSKYFILPNLIKYFSPPTEFLGYYNLGGNRVDDIAQIWFSWKDNRLGNLLQKKQIKITELFPILLAVSNLTFITGLIAFTIIGGIKNCSKTTIYTLLFVVGIWLSNLIFSVLSAPIVLRYQIFTLCYTSTFSSLLISYLVRYSTKGNNYTNIFHQKNPNPDNAFN